MSERVATLAEAAEAFRIFGAAEGSRIPTYARICEVIAADPELHGLRLEAPTGQRLPVLLLAALHDVVLRHPECALAPWYPSVTGEAASLDDPAPALHEGVDDHRDELIVLLTTRQVQTNEVNRCCAWWWALGGLTADDSRPIHLIEIGASAGITLRLDDYSYELEVELTTAESVDWSAPSGRADSAVRLSTVLRDLTTPLDDLAAAQEQWREQWQRPRPVVSRVGLDQHPLHVTDPQDARWLEACVWPEQTVRFARLTAALGAAEQDPPRLVTGDLVDDLAPLLESAPHGAHVVVLSSWVLAYVPRARRSGFVDLLAAAAVDIGERGGRLSLLTLEADPVLPWMPAPPVPEDAPAEVRHASILAVTSFDNGVPVARPIARYQAHLAWMQLL
ncbi:DUF2332 domain-containing protein [soil metagenome]